MVTLLTFWGTSRLFFIVVVSVYIPTIFPGENIYTVLTSHFLSLFLSISALSSFCSPPSSSSSASFFPFPLSFLDLRWSCLPIEKIRETDAFLFQFDDSLLNSRLISPGNSFGMALWRLPSYTSLFVWLSEWVSVT